jgi:hypothetical protein
LKSGPDGLPRWEAGLGRVFQFAQLAMWWRGVWQISTPVEKSVLDGPAVSGGGRGALIQRVFRMDATGAAVPVRRANLGEGSGDAGGTRPENALWTSGLSVLI